MKTYAFFNNSFFIQKPWWLPIKLYSVICQRSNPRTQEYMLALLREKFPDAELISKGDSCQIGRIILLYPDSIGLGWSGLEKEYIKKFKEGFFICEIDTLVKWLYKTYNLPEGTNV